MAEKLSPVKVDVALLPINGRAAERRIPGNLFEREAAHLAQKTSGCRKVGGVIAQGLALLTLVPAFALAAGAHCDPDGSVTAAD
jgi:hypothetical protein